MNMNLNKDYINGLIYKVDWIGLRELANYHCNKRHVKYKSVKNLRI